MKRKTICLLLLFTVLFIVGCNKKEENNNTSAPEATATATPTPTPINQAMHHLEELLISYDEYLEKHQENGFDYSSGFGCDVSMDFSIGKQVAGVLGLTGIDSVGIKGTVDSEDNVNANLNLYLNSTEIINVDVFADDNNVWFNLPKYSSAYAKATWEELLELENIDLPDALGSVSTEQSRASAKALSKQFRKHLTDFIDCFKSTEGITKDVSLGTGTYRITGEKHTVVANPEDVKAVFTNLEADIKRICGEQNIHFDEWDFSGAQALNLDYYVGDDGSFAWSFYADNNAGEPLVFVSAKAGFCCYTIEEGAEVVLMSSVKSSEKAGTITVFEGEEEDVIIEYEYSDTSLHADIFADNTELSIDLVKETEGVSCDYTLVTNGMSVIVKAKAVKKHVDLSVTVASLGISYGTLDVTLDYRDYTETPLPADAVDMEAWSMSLDQIGLLSDMLQILKDYPALYQLLINGKFNSN